MEKQAVAEMLSAFMHGGERIEKMSKDDPKRVKGETLGARFTEGVGMLRRFPNPQIRALADMVWQVVGHRIVPIALGPSVPSLTFGAMGSAARPDGIIFVPHEWEAMIKENAVYQLGALVFVGSQAVDYYNGRVGYEPEAMMKRARANEAEYLVTIRETVPDYTFNDWQNQMLTEFPEGLRSERIKKHLYTHKAFAVSPTVWDHVKTGLLPDD